MTRRACIRDESGFTLIELLVAMSVGMIVLLAVHAAFDSTLTASARVEDRTEATQRGRTAMEQLTQRLRSQACPNASTPSIESGSSDAVRLWVDIDDEAFAPRKIELAYSTAANGSLIERRYASAGAWPVQNLYPALAGQRYVLTNVGRIDGVVFRYYAFNSDGVISGTPLPTPLSATNRARVVKVRVTFNSRATRRGTTASGQLDFDNSVYIRTSNPFDPNAGPLCG